MKSKVYIVLLILLLLSACSTNKTNSTTNSGDPNSSQITDASTSDSAISTSSPEDENSLPTNAYKDVLQNEVGFTSTDDNLEFFLNDFLSRNSEYEGIYKVTHFTVIDMDGDQTPEVVLELSLVDYPEQYEILHYSSGMVYGYNFVYRGFEMPKADGTYSYANSAADVGVEKIVNFNSVAVETETSGYAQADYSGGNIVNSYFINNASVVEEAFNTFCDQQNEKKDVQWYEFSAENIEAKVSMDWNTNSLSEATDHQKSYYGEWVVKKVLAYGIGTYSSDEAEKLIGKSLIFSADEAYIFNDQPQETPIVINSPEYQETTKLSSDFQRDYKMSFDALGITTDVVTEVQITGRNNVGGFIVKDSDTIILIAGGTYFELVKQ